MVASHNAVLFALHFVFSLVDGKVERGLEQAVFPRFVDVKLIVELSFPRQEVYDNGHCSKEDAAFIEELLIRELSFGLETFHKIRIFCLQNKKKTGSLVCQTPQQGEL